METQPNWRSGPHFSTEPQSLQSAVDQVRDWIHDVSEWGMPRFGELGSRLECLRSLLAQQRWQSDKAPGKQPVSSSSVAEALQRIPERLESLVRLLSAPEPLFSSWQAAAEQAESLLNEICANYPAETPVSSNAG